MEFGCHLRPASCKACTLTPLSPHSCLWRGNSRAPETSGSIKLPFLLSCGAGRTEMETWLLQMRQGPEVCHPPVA